MLFSAMRLFLQPSRLRTEGRGTSRERRSPRGFTLLETLVVISISGLLLGVSHITLGKLAPQFDLDNATRMTVMAINQAQVRAITRGENTTIDFGSGSNGFTISDAGGAVVAVRDLPASITVSSGTLTFTPLGTLQDIASGWVYLWNGSSGRWMWVLRSGEVIL